MAGLVEAKLRAEVEKAKAALEWERLAGAASRSGGPGRAAARRRLDAAQEAVRAAEASLRRAAGGRR